MRRCDFWQATSRKHKAKLLIAYNYCLLRLIQYCSHFTSQNEVCAILRHSISMRIKCKKTGVDLLAHNWSCSQQLAAKSLLAQCKSQLYDVNNVQRCPWCTLSDDVNDMQWRRRNPAWRAPFLINVLGHPEKQINARLLHLLYITYTSSSTGFKSGKFEGHICLLVLDPFWIDVAVQ